MSSISGLFSDPLVESLWTQFFFFAKLFGSNAKHFWPIFRPSGWIDLDADYFFSQNAFDRMPSISGLSSDPLVESLWTLVFLENDCYQIPSISGLFSDTPIESLWTPFFFSRTFLMILFTPFLTLFRLPDWILLDVDFFTRKIEIIIFRPFLVYFQTLWSYPSRRWIFSQNWNHHILTTLTNFRPWTFVWSQIGSKFRQIEPKCRQIDKNEVKLGKMSSKMTKCQKIGLKCRQIGLKGRQIGL